MSHTLMVITNPVFAQVCADTCKPPGLGPGAGDIDTPPPVTTQALRVKGPY